MNKCFFCKKEILSHQNRFACSCKSILVGERCCAIKQVNTEFRCPNCKEEIKNFKDRDGDTMIFWAQWLAEMEAIWMRIKQRYGIEKQYELWHKKEKEQEGCKVKVRQGNLFVKKIT